MRLLATLFGNLHVLALGQERGPVADEMHHTPSVDSIKSEAYTNCVCVCMCLCGKAGMIYWGKLGHCTVSHQRKTVGITSYTRNYKQ